MYDFIGDIHGHADKLTALLLKLGYTKSNGFYQHPDRKVFFLGDFIDRGPKIKETLEIVRGMIDNGAAKTVMANHEFNMICLQTMGKHGEYLRPRRNKNIKQVSQTYAQLTIPELEEYTQWFETLPLFYEEESFRAVHACWDQQAVDYLKAQFKSDLVNIKMLQEHYYEGTEFFKQIELLLKGPEQELPNGLFFHDKDMHKRTQVRVSWWDKEMMVVAEAQKLKDQLNPSMIEHPFYPSDEKLVFFGHYWLPYKTPQVTAPNAQCMDFSAAKGGILVSYRHDGESLIDPTKFVFVP